MMKYIKPPDFKSVKEFEAYYKKVEQDIHALLMDGSARNADELNKRISLAVDSAMSFLSKKNQAFTKDELATAFKEGQDGVKAPPKVSVSAAAELLAGLGYRYAKNGLTRDVYIELQTATQAAGNGFKTRVNSIIEQLRKDGKDSVYNVQQAIAKDLEEHNVFEVKYSNGAKQPLYAYAAMAARSARIESANIGAIGRAIQAGTDYVKMTTVPQCCKLCGAYQGKVYCISGKDKRFPALFKTVLKNGYALPHPNCRHEFIPWFIELESPEDVEKAIKESKIQYDKKGNLVDVRFQKDIEGYQSWQAGNRQRNRERLAYQQMQQHYKGRESDMPYKSLASFRRARRSEAFSPAYKKWRNRKADENQYNRWKEIIGEENLPETVDDFQEIKYNKNKQQEFENLKQIREQEVDYKIAATGGSHSGKLADYQKNFSLSALEKTVKNLEGKIKVHLKKIDNPQSYYEDWDKLSVVQQEGNKKHWRKEISSFKAQRNIALAEIRRRKK